MKKLSLSYKINNKTINYVDVNYQTLLEKYCSENDGAEGTVIFSLEEMEKTWPQIKFFHGVVVKAVARAMGELFDADTLKYVKGVLKDLFLRVYIENGKDKFYIPSLRDLSKREMSAFITSCLNHLIYFLNGRFTPEEHSEYKNYKEWEKNNIKKNKGGL